MIKEVDFNGISGRINFVNGRSRSTKIQINQWFNGERRIVGHFNPIIKSNEVSGGDLNLMEEKIVWLSGRIPDDGTLPCALNPLDVILHVTCTEATILLNAIILIVGVISLAICAYKYKKRVDKKSAAELTAYGLGPNRKIPDLDNWEISRSDIVINRELGRGAFGIVYGGEAKIKDKWVPVAVKELRTKNLDDLIDFLSEAKMMKNLNHPNIMTLLGICSKDDPFYTVMEFMLYGDLKTFLLARRNLVHENMLDENNELTYKKLTTMALDIAKALTYLANENLVHRDVACRNCLVNAKRVVKLGDFGMSRVIPDTNYYRFIRKGMLPVRWMAPESISEGVFTLASDIWSFGVLLYEFITLGNFPFQNMNNDQVFEYVKMGNHMDIPEDFVPEL